MLTPSNLMSYCGRNGIRMADNADTHTHTHTQIKALNLKDLHILMQGSAHLPVCCHHGEMWFII